MTCKKFLSVAALLVFGTGVLHAQTSLVAHWTFDEVSGTTAQDSKGSFNGTLAAGAAFVAGGISGNAVSLNGAANSFVNMGTSLPGFTSGDYSLVAWIKTTTAGSSVAAGKHESGTLNGYFFAVNTGSGYGLLNKAYFYDSTNAGGVAVSTTTINDNLWHQLIGVYTAGGNVQIYVDGVLAGTNSSSTMAGNSAPFLVGGVNVSSTPTGSFAGLIDDVQLYSAALSLAEVQLLFANPGQTTAIPEPSSWAMLTGVLALGLARWRRRAFRSAPRKRGG